nr:SWIM zinc finger family protein [Xanthobacter tagetidis]
MFEGSGGGLRAFCTCPAGGRGGRFCKHAAGLLMGDVTALVGRRPKRGRGPQGAGARLAAGGAGRHAPGQALPTHNGGCGKPCGCARRLRRSDHAPRPRGRAGR